MKVQRPKHWLFLTEKEKNKIINAYIENCMLDVSLDDFMLIKYDIAGLNRPIEYMGKIDKIRKEMGIKKDENKRNE